MEARPVSRCIAIAAHGKRCQQSPFRGSPYCWHHTQSRKVWPPSRPAAASGRSAILDDAAHRDGQEAEARAREDAAREREVRMREDGRAAARRLADTLGVDDVAALVAFVAGDAGDELTLRRTPDGFAAGSRAASPAGTPSD